MKTFADLESATNDFFRLHWPAAESFGSPPTWVSWDQFLRGSVPNYTRGGCYALFENERLAYIGKGVGIGNKSTPQHGISRRLSSHVICVAGYTEKKGQHLSKLRGGWENVTAISTVGFLASTEYIAHSLENFLIRQLQPPRNRHL